MWSWKCYIKEMSKDSKAYICVGEILQDLADRRGLSQEFESIDADVQKEMIDKWACIVREYLQEDRGMKAYVAQILIEADRIDEFIKSESVVGALLVFKDREKAKELCGGNDTLISFMKLNDEEDR